MSTARMLIVATVASTLDAFLTPFAEYFRGQGWRVDAMASGASETREAAAFDRTWDVEWTRDPTDIANIRSALPHLREIAEAEEYDIVHTHTPVASFVTRLAMRPLRRARGLRVVYTAHGFHFSPELGASRTAVYMPLEKLAGQWTDRLIVMNSDDLDAARRYRIVPDTRLEYVHGIGVDTERFDPGRLTDVDRAALRTELRLDDSAVLFTCVAEFIPRKRPLQVIEALAKADSRIHVAFAGEGPLLREAREHSADLGVDGRTHFLGWRDDIPRVIGASRATLLFSEHEGLPRSSMESLSLGVPVIGANIRGIRDLLADDCGILVPPGDTSALASAMDRLASDAGSAARMGRHGRAKMEGPYSLPSVLSEYQRIYAEMLTARDTADSPEDAPADAEEGPS